MIRNSIQVKKTATYYQNTTDLKDIEKVWICLHGYGQLAKFFANRFVELDSKRHLVVVPEGLSRFYLQGFSGRVGATWMTKEDREADIQDYIKYLDDLLVQLKSALNGKVVEWVVLGFSQGAATACRWVNAGKVNPNHLVLWAGIFPPDLSPGGKITNQELKTWYLIGDEDPFKSEAKEAEFERIKNELGIIPTHIDFKGAHRIYPKPLLDLAERL